MIQKFIRNYIIKNKVTLLGAGPMSKNCVDTAVELANTHKIPIMLIASRRQIECAKLGGGYVENWTTEKFVDYVEGIDSGKQVILARDHGGPWQHPSENKMNLSDAMDSAKQSYAVDIRSGMRIIHIDPSIDPHGTPSSSQLMERVFDLYSFCWDLAQKEKKDIAFEIGTEEQDTEGHSEDELTEILSAVVAGCKKHHLPPPLFVVTQTGTKVMERRNVGNFEGFTKGRKPTELNKLLEICNRHSVMMKEHNTDYLSNAALALHPKLGVHAANVAPEYGVIESLAFIRLAEQNGLKNLSERFLEISYNSKRWEKWMLANTSADEREKAIICGHYVFARPEFAEIKEQLKFALKRKKTDLDEQLKIAIRASMERYLVGFGLITAAVEKKVI